MSTCTGGVLTISTFGASVMVTLTSEISSCFFAASGFSEGFSFFPALPSFFEGPLEESSAAGVFFWETSVEDDFTTSPFRLTPPSAAGSFASSEGAVFPSASFLDDSYTHLTLPTNQEV